MDAAGPETAWRNRGGAGALALFILDPARDLTPVFVLLALGVPLVLAARRMRER